jgi:hypothetical protein
VRCNAHQLHRHMLLGVRRWSCLGGCGLSCSAQPPVVCDMEATAALVPGLVITTCAPLVGYTRPEATAAFVPGLVITCHQAWNQRSSGLRSGVANNGRWFFNTQAVFHSLRVCAPKCSGTHPALVVRMGACPWRTRLLWEGWDKV